MNKSEKKEHLKRVDTHREKEEYIEAITILKELHSQEPYDSYILGLLGGLLWLIGDLEEAVIHLRKAVQISPRNHRLSISLYHSLYDVGLPSEACKEAERFLTAKKPAIFQGIKKPFLIDELLQLYLEQEHDFWLKDMDLKEALSQFPPYRSYAANILISQKEKKT